MKIINTSKNVTLADNVVLAQTAVSRLKGLLFYKEFKKGEALIIRPCNSIHTFFMRFPIDVIFVGANDKIVKIHQGIKPFKVTPIYFKSDFVIELPAGILEATGTTASDILLVEP
jgi:hypothetical protein